MEAEHYAAIFCRTVANVNDWSADADCAEGISWHPHVIDLYMAPQWQEYNGTLCPKSCRIFLCPVESES